MNNTQGYSRLFIIVIVMQFFNTPAYAKNDFFEQRYRGWLWFDEAAQEEERTIEHNIPTAKEAETAITARKEALDNARNIMLETAYRPNISKKEFLKAVENYRHLEREMKIMALKVGMSWDETNILNPGYVDERNNPTNIYGRKKKEELDAKRDGAILKALANKSEMFIFRGEGCGYCHDMEKHLDRFAKKYGFKVEAVSLDNSDSPYFKTTHSKELIVALELEYLPTVLLVVDGDTHRYQISEGLVSVEDLERNTLQAASLFKQGISKSNMRRN